MQYGSHRKGTVYTQRLYIVMVCDDAAEAAQATHEILQVNNSVLVTYRRAEDVLLKGPSGRVALIILANHEAPQATEKVLSWMRHRWPKCPIAVIGEAGAVGLEMAARKGGASYLARPVTPEQWTAVIGHVLAAEGRTTTDKRSG